MKRFSMTLLLFLSFSLFGCVNSEEHEPRPHNQPGPAQTDEKAAVASLVEDFGSKLKRVPLLAPSDIVNKSLQEQYGDLVSPELLSQWLNDPHRAPGRVTSSPWPDRIEILSIDEVSDDTYAVQGEIIEITSVEQVSGGVAARLPITLAVKKVNHRWLITAVTLGPYE